MQARIEKGHLVVSVPCLIERLTPEEKKEMIQYLACDPEIMDEVAAQIVDGCTSEGWHGPISCGASLNPTRGIEAARRKVAEASSQIAKDEIGRLKRELESEQKSRAHWVAEYHKANNARMGYRP